MRQKLQSPQVGISIAVAVIGLAVYVTMSSGTKPPKMTEHAFYYDLETKSLFRAKPGLVPLAAAPSGPDKAALAYVFACGSCTEPPDRFVGYIEKYTDDAKEAMKVRDVGKILAGHLVKRPEDADWVTRTGAQGEAINKGLQTHCDGKPAMPCKADQTPDVPAIGKE